VEIRPPISTEIRTRTSTEIPAPDQDPDFR
jgi:hypothetical protein